MLGWSRPRLLITLAIAVLIVMEPVSWMTASIPGCIVNPENYTAYYGDHNQCPTFHVFLILLVVRVLDHLGDPNWVIADFTAVLAFSTICLWVVTWRASVRQSSDMEASIAVAKQSAEAAIRATENAEKALRSLEVPHVYPVEMKFSVFEDAHGAPLVATVSASLKNFGRSPAFLKEIYLIVAVTNIVRRVGERPLYHSGYIPFMAEDVIGDKETVGPFEKSIFELLPYCSRIKDGSLQLGLLVNHRIDDALDHTRGQGSWYVWNPRRQKFVAGVQLWTDN